LGLTFDYSFQDNAQEEKNESDNDRTDIDTNW
jgi:hypothetical protein